jgi:hypothetical protein
MKKLKAISLSLAVLLLFCGIVFLWPNSNTGITKIKLTGIAGTAFSGSYVQEGHRTQIAGVLPWELERRNVTQFEFRKHKPEDLFRFEIDHSCVGHSLQTGPVDSAAGMRVRVGLRNVRLTFFK